MKRIFVAGHKGMVGSAIYRKLSDEGSNVLVTASKSELDLTDQRKVREFVGANSIDEIYLAAARVGGISANNKYPADFIYQNLMIQANIIHSAHENNIQKLLFLGSSCIYPKITSQPMREDALLSGVLEGTNEPYAVAKIAGIKLCESYNRQYGRDYRSVMPTNLYGVNDNFHLENSHVIPALIRRFHEAKLSRAPVVKVWGTGQPMREFLYVDDMADASIFVMNLDVKSHAEAVQVCSSHINVGTGLDCTIREVAEMIRSVVGYDGKIEWDQSKPDGTPRKLLDVSRLEALGWQSKISLEYGLQLTYEWFLKSQHKFRG